MSVEKMFETATRLKMRFPFKGQVSVEDLWDLSPENLDSIFKVLNSQLKQSTEESLLQKRTVENKELDVKINIVKYIVEVKLKEAQKKLESKQRKEEKQKIMQILAAKQDQELQNKSQEELQDMLSKMEEE